MRDYVKEDRELASAKNEKIPGIVARQIAILSRKPMHMWEVEDYELLDVHQRIQERIKKQT